MNPATPWLVRTGSVRGRSHARCYRNNQDACAVRQTPTATIAVVADGCSEGAYSEFGARLGVEWMASHLAARAGMGAHQSLDAKELAESATAGLVRALARATKLMAPTHLPGDLASQRAAMVHRLFLFTFLAAIVDDRRARIFGVGDGVVHWQGETRFLEAGPDNAPDYAAYGLNVGTARVATPIVHLDCRNTEVARIAIATDGARPLFEAPSGGIVDPVTDLTGARFVKNPSLVEKWLRVQVDKDPRCADDVTMAVLFQDGSRGGP
jgi:hypothetical protein